MCLLCKGFRRPKWCIVAYRLVTEKQLVSPNWHQAFHTLIAHIWLLDMRERDADDLFRIRVVCILLKVIIIACDFFNDRSKNIANMVYVHSCTFCPTYNTEVII